MPDLPQPQLLPESPNVSQKLQDRLATDFTRFAADGLPSNLEDFLIDEYCIDVASKYAGYEIRNPWGKASGQLSMTARRVQDDADAGLGFVVLKTVIAEDGAGGQSMAAWAVKESRMLVERITGRSGEQGWTVSWKGRGWWHLFDDYLQLIRDAKDIGDTNNMLIVPSCKYHLPSATESEWNREEYRFTTQAILQAWQASDETPMPLEKDFSPTLAGSDLATVQSQIIDWLKRVPELIRFQGAASNANKSPVRIGLKLFNTMFDDDFQLRMLEAVHDPEIHQCDFLIPGNRLFDPEREFDGHFGIAYGGPDLSDRNLRVMHAFLKSNSVKRLPWSATGNILSGRIAIEYAMLGASSFQLHTGFQLPSEAYAMKVGNKTQKALHQLYFHPQDGFIVWMHHLAGERGLAERPIRFQTLFDF